MYTRELLKTELTELKEKQVKVLIISIQDERSLSCIDSISCRNTIPLKAHTTAKYAFTEHGCECPFSSTTAESSAVTPTLSRDNSHAFTIKALLHCATPVPSTKYGRVDVNSTKLFGTHRGAKHIGRQTQWQTPTYTFDGQNELDSSMSVDITMPDCSS